MNSKSKGILITSVIAILSTIIGKKFEIIGAPIIGIILGIIINNVFTLSDKFTPGIKFSSKYILQASVVILGFTLNLNQVREVGLSSISVTLCTVTITFIGAYVIGRALSVNNDLRNLIGVGTAICGGSAIAAVAPIIEPEEHDLAYAMSTIFLFNVIAAVIFPILGHLLKMDDQTFGLWAGTAINDTSSVVAAGYVYSEAAGNYATIVKLSRATLIIPISLIFAALKLIKTKNSKTSSSKSVKLHSIFPWFILLFLVASLIGTVVNLSAESKFMLSETAKFMIVMALSGIGLSTKFKKMFESGIKPILLGFYLWILISVTSLGIQYLEKII